MKGQDFPAGLVSGCTSGSLDGNGDGLCGSGHHPSDSSRRCPFTVYVTDINYSPAPYWVGSRQPSAWCILITFSLPFLVGNLMGKEGEFPLGLTGKFCEVFSRIFCHLPIVKCFA